MAEKCCYNCDNVEESRGFSFEENIYVCSKEEEKIFLAEDKDALKEMGKNCNHWKSK